MYPSSHVPPCLALPCPSWSLRSKKPKTSNQKPVHLSQNENRKQNTTSLQQCLSARDEWVVELTKMSVENRQMIVCEIEDEFDDANLGESGRVEVATTVKRCSSPQHIPQCYPSHPTPCDL